tara:strand:- start:32 stop:313 length:282 start_codon:yes stop_codon:yes gene_type:complete
MHFDTDKMVAVVSLQYELLDLKRATSAAVQSVSQQQLASHWFGVKLQVHVQSNLQVALFVSTQLQPAGKPRGACVSGTVLQSAVDKGNTWPSG